MSYCARQLKSMIYKGKGPCAQAKLEVPGRGTVSFTLRDNGVRSQALTEVRLLPSTHSQASTHTCRQKRKGKVPLTI
jgi:hypothetical protein